MTVRFGVWTTTYYLPTHWFKSKLARSASTFFFEEQQPPPSEGASVAQQPSAQFSAYTFKSLPVPAIRTSKAAQSAFLTAL